MNTELRGPRAVLAIKLRILQNSTQLLIKSSADIVGLQSLPSILFVLSEKETISASKITFFFDFPGGVPNGRACFVSPRASRIMLV